MPPKQLSAQIDQAFGSMQQARERFTLQFAPSEVGMITAVSTGIASVVGLHGIGFEELVRFPGGLYGIAFNVDAEEIGVVLLGE
jgi:F-type H+-transporting ATPase subunit alpha